MRTCPCLSHLPDWEWQLSNDKRLSGFGATWRTAWRHQHPGTKTWTADEYVQSVGSQRRSAAHRLLHVYRTMCTGATAGGSLAWQACLAQQARNGSPFEIASTTAFWKEAWECQNTAQNPTGLGEGTMQSMCTAWLPWTEQASGTHADHPRLCGAAPPCLPENPMNSRQQPQKMKMGKACPNRHTASRCLQPNCHT